MSEARRALRWIVSGRVQGVWYRAFTERAARQLGLVGRVRNLPDGSVEVEVEGDAEALAALRARLLEGPPASRVDGIDEAPLPDSPEEPRWETFEIRY